MWRGIIDVVERLEEGSSRILCHVQYVDLIKGHLDKAATEASAAGREGTNTDTQALATRIHDTMYKHFGESANDLQ